LFFTRPRAVCVTDKQIPTYEEWYRRINKRNSEGNPGDYEVDEELIKKLEMLFEHCGEGEADVII